MKIQIIGLNHQIQRRSIGSWGSDGKPQAFEKDQKEHFAELIQQWIRGCGITLVCEEARNGEASLAEAVCESENCAYRNIEMTPEERHQHNIPPGYAESTVIPQHEKDRGNAIREADMVAKILAEGQRHDCLLVFCGRMHMEALAARLRDSGHTVATDDLQNQSWYIEDWQHHMMYEL